MLELKKSMQKFCLMELNIDETFEGKLTYAFKNDMSNLANFHQSSCSKVWKLAISWDPFGIQSSKKIELKIYRAVLCLDNEEWYKIWLGIDLSVQNWHEEFDKFWPEHSKIPKIYTLIGSFWRQYVMLELKKV